jgi:hypothetical protein
MGKALQEPDEFELEARRKYQRNRNIKNNTTTIQLSEYSVEEQIAIKKLNVEQVTNRRFKQELLKKMEPLLPNWKSLLLDFISRKLSVLKDTQINTPYFDPEKKIIKISYVRYADDWIIGVRGSQEICENIMDDVEQFLKQELGLTLSRDKTKITDIKNNKALFLGYEIFYQQNPLIRRRKDTSTIQRYTGLQFHPDTSRLESRFKLKNIMNPDGTPREVGFLTVLEDHEIIEKFNQFMIGLGNYYINNISYPSRLNRWHYLLYYSCIKTLACKHKSTVKAIINKYGYLDLTKYLHQFNNQILTHDSSNKPSATNLRIVSFYTRDEEIKQHVLYNYKEFMFRLKIIKNNKTPPSPTIDFLCLHKVNCRTAFKLSSMCAICSSKYKLQNHHIKPILHSGGKYKTYKGFDKIVASLGRKQITVCGYCHIKIHNGEYDGMKLEYFYDTRLVPSEGYIDLSDYGEPTNKSKNKVKVVSEYLFDHRNKTIINSFINNYNLKLI